MWGVRGRCWYANEGAFRRPFEECGNFTKRWLCAATKNDAEIALVVLGAWEILDLKIDGMTLEVGTVTADRIFDRQLRLGIDTLLMNGWSLRFWRFHASVLSTVGTMRSSIEETIRTPHISMT